MAIQDRRENLWAIVLAAGEGTRLSTLRARPKVIDTISPPSRTGSASSELGAA